MGHRKRFLGWEHFLFVSRGQRNFSLHSNFGLQTDGPNQLILSLSSDRKAIIIRKRFFFLPRERLTAKSRCRKPGNRTRAKFHRSFLADLSAKWQRGSEGTWCISIPFVPERNERKNLGFSPIGVKPNHGIEWLKCRLHFSSNGEKKGENSHFHIRQKLRRINERKQRRKISCQHFFCEGKLLQPSKWFSCVFLFLCFFSTSQF